MLKHPGRLARFALLCLLGGALQAPACADPLTDDARRLLDGGDGRAAYVLLEPRESERAGEVGYDFLLGLAALEIGENTRAVFALERVLAIEPNHVRARAEIARAYLALGEVETARQEFENVRRQGVPADVSLTLERYIAAARRLENQDRPGADGYLELLLGYDSNVNVGPNRSSVVIPGISATPARLSRDSQANKDAFAQVGAGVSGRLPLRPDLALLGSLSWSRRLNEDKDQFNLGSYDASAGVVYTEGKSVVTAMAQFASVGVDDARYRTAAGVTGQWQYNLDARNQLSAFLQFSNLHYVDQAIRDADRQVGGIAYAHLWRDGLVAFGSVYAVSEQAQDDDVDYIGFDGAGVRLGGRFNLSERTTLFAGVSYEHRRYGESDPSFLTRRRDDQYGLLFGASYSLARSWTLTPQVSLARNSSNTDINDYHREMVSLAIRREF